MISRNALGVKEKNADIGMHREDQGLATQIANCMLRNELE
jgi:hypothetical protein